MEKVGDLSKNCKEFFNQKADLLSIQTGFIKRKRKLTGSAFLKALIFSHLQDPKSSINVMCQWLSEEAIVMSKQGFDLRFTQEAVEFMRAMCLEALNLFKRSLPLECEILQQFQSVKLLDSSYITLPNSMENRYKGYGSNYPGHPSPTLSGIKLQLIFDYLNQAISHLELTEGIRADAGYRGHLDDIKSGDLLISDLGYFVPESFKKMSQLGAYFISRYKSDTNLYDMETGCKIELVELLNNKTFWCKEVLLGKESQIKVRLICEKLTAEQSVARRRKANKLAKSHGYKSSERNQRLLDWSIFITNIPEGKVSNHQILKIYRVRWQIELLFKLYKSHIKIDQFLGKKPYRILCEFYAKLCIILIFHGLISCIRLAKNTEISLTKAYIYLKRWAIEFFVLLGQSTQKLKVFFHKLSQGWLKFSLKDSRHRKKLSTLQTIRMLSIH